MAISYTILSMYYNLFNNFLIAEHLSWGKLESVMSIIFMDIYIPKALSPFLIIFSGYILRYGIARSFERLLVTVAKLFSSRAVKVKLLHEIVHVDHLTYNGLSVTGRYYYVAIQM